MWRPHGNFISPSPGFGSLVIVSKLASESARDGPRPLQGLYAGNSVPRV